jgi:D-glycero-alpha-D-manno-heptose-7-phosphate kinase
VPATSVPLIAASAPVRICDNGGWTDTWFGGPGRVVNIAVTPGVEVSVQGGAGPDPVVLDVGDYGDRYPVVPGKPGVARHALLEAAIAALPPPPDAPAVEITVRSGVPAGCGTGTSAAVAVAMLGALSALRGEAPTLRDVAYAAHRLEVEVLGGQSGIQDQLSAAFGGINYLEIDAYPDATVESLPAWDDLGPRLTLVFLGRAHDSSEVHRQVIEGVTGPGSRSFAQLRAAAVAARDAVIAQDLAAFGRAMIANTDAQMSLHAELVGSDARRVIDLAAARGALGWKVNGAGGDGGSVTILSPTVEDKQALDAQVAALDPSYRMLPVRVSAVGLRVAGAAGSRPIASTGGT